MHFTSFANTQLRRLKIPAIIYQRNRRIITAALGLLFAKSISLMTLIFTVPLTLHHLGAERFGVWMTLTSLTSILGTADFGVGNGLMTELAKRSGANDSSSISKSVTNGLVTLILLFTVFTVIFLVFFPFLNFSDLFGVKSNVASSETNSAALIFFVTSFLSIPAMLGQRMMIGLQMGWWSGLWFSFSSLTSLVMLLVAVALDAGLPGMMLAFVGSPVAVLIAGTVWTLRKHPEIRVRFSIVEWAEVRRLAKQGSRFFIVTVIYAITFTADNIVIARTLGPDAVALYSVSDRLFQIIAVALTMINAPLWPAYAEAYAKGNGSWVVATFRKSIALNLLFGGGAAIILVSASKWVFPLWIGSAVTPPLVLLAWIAIRRLMEALYNACNNMMNAIDMITLQIAFGCAMASSAMLLRVWLVSPFGIIGVPIAVTAAVGMFGLAPAGIALRRIQLRFGKAGKCQQSN
jgi:O-antigen/teichoic acid export membrane protein